MKKLKISLFVIANFDFRLFYKFRKKTFNVKNKRESIPIFYFFNWQLQIQFLFFFTLLSAYEY